MSRAPNRFKPGALPVATQGHFVALGAGAVHRGLGAVNLAARALAVGLMACGTAVAAAAGWSVHLADGRTLAIVADGAVGPFAQTLERRLADGTLDRQFGSAGRVVISLGAESPGPRSIRSDAAGRILVIGAAMGPEGHAVPASLRYLPDGRIDLSWGTQGRGLIPSRGADAFGADVLAMPDESVLVLGQIENESTEQAALWRLGRNGTFDGSFGQEGAMRATGLEASLALGLQLDDDGAALIAVQTERQGRPWLEVHRWQTGQEQPQRVAYQPMPGDWQGPATLARRGGTWQWFDASQPISSGGVPLVAVAATTAWRRGSSPVPTPAAADAPGPSEGGAVWNPFSPGPEAESAAAAAAVAPAVTSSPIPWTALAAFAIAVLAGVGWWRRKRRQSGI